MSTVEEISKVYDSVLIDASNLAYRMWWGVSDLKYNDKHVGLEFGFIRRVLSYIRHYGNNKIFLAWDGEPVRAKSLCENYKAGRTKVNSEELPWGPRLDRLRVAFSTVCNCLYHPQEEADEQIAKYVLNKKENTLIISNDKDMQQLINNCVHIEANDDLLTPEKIIVKWGLPSIKIPLFKALDGDSSDNIQGVPRLFTKTKIRLVNESNDIENLVNNFNLPWLSIKEKEKLSLYKTNVINNYKIVNLLNLDGNFNLMSNQRNLDDLQSIITEMNFKSINLNGI